MNMIRFMAGVVIGVVGATIFSIGSNIPSSNKVTTTDCPNGCVSKECHVYSIWVDDDMHNLHRGFKDGPCTCNYGNSNGTLITICEDYIKKERENSASSTVAIVGACLFCFGGFIMHCSERPDCSDRQFDPLHTAEDTHNDEDAPNSVENV